jgi:hypothetical protein
MLSEEQEMIWPPCGSGAGDALGDAAGAGFAFALECVLNTIIKTRTTIASGANAIMENRFAGSFMMTSPQLTWNCEIENVRGAYQKKIVAVLSVGRPREWRRQRKSENNR